MGLFNRKSKPNVNGDFIAQSQRTSSSSLMSPPPNKVINGGSFNSPSVPDVSLPAPPDPSLDPAAYLRSIYAVRQRTRLVYQRAKRNNLNHFIVDGSKFRETADYVVSIIKVRSMLPSFLLHYINAPQISHNKLMFLSARSRSRLFFHSRPRSMATLRSRRPTAHRSTSLLLALTSRCSRTHPTAP